MPTFRYRAMGQDSAAATIEAADRTTAVRELLRRGVTPTGVEEVAAARPGHAPSVGGLLGRRSMSRAETAAFVRELATAVQAGLPLVPALKTIARQGGNPYQRAMLNKLIDEVEQGRSLADAAAAWGRPFSDLVINLIRAGEASGKLDVVLAQAAELLDRDVKLRRSLLGATLYPIILLGLLVVAVAVIVTVVVPKVIESFEGQMQLPLPTLILKQTADFSAAYWWAVLGGVAAAVFIGRRTYADPAWRLRIDGWLLKAPILGRLLRDVAVARFTRTLATLTAAGIPAVSALRITKGTLGNKAMERVVDEVCEQVSAGRTIADPMEQSGYFPPMLVQIVNLGERSGRLEELLAQAAGAFEDRTESSIKLFTTALPPLLVAVMACVVGLVVLAVLLPFIEYQELVLSR